MRRIFVIICLTVSACGEWPDLGAPMLEQSSRDWPTLLPLSEVISGGSFAVAQDSDAERLANRAAALRARARIMRSNAGDIDAMEALRSRLGR